MAKRPAKSPARNKTPSKRTPSQKRRALSKQVDKLLPADPAIKGETVVPDSLLKKVKNALEK